MTLFIGLYDFAQGTYAYEYDGKEIHRIELTFTQYDMVYMRGYLDCEEQLIYNDLLLKYDKVIVCENGEFEILK